MITSAPTTTFGDWGKIAVEKHFTKILNHETGVLKDRDPEELHQMRVGIRRLRSAMLGFAPAIALPPTSTEKIAGKIGKTLGKLRDLDVLQLTIATEYLPNLPKSEQKQLAKVTKLIAKQRKKAFKQVESTLEGKVYQHFKQGLKDWLAQPNYTSIAATKIELILPDLLLPQVSQLLLHPGWFVGIDLNAEAMNLESNATIKQVEALLEQEEPTLHDLRKAAKKTRYNMDLFAQFYGDKFNNYLKKIKNIQEILGVIQDCFVFRTFLEQTFNTTNLEQYLPTLIQQFNQQRYQKWQEWEALQKQFLDLPTRQDFQKAIIEPNL